MTNNTAPQRGFTLIETLMAILVLTIAIAGPLTIASKGLTTALTAKNQVIASYLAQDAIEYIRFLRDTNRLSNQSWLTNLGPCTSADGSVSCYLDSLSQNPAVPTVCSGTCPALWWDPGSGAYTYTQSGTIASPYTRMISIKTPIGGSSDEASVTVVVSWADAGGFVRSVTMQEDILNWQ